MQANKANNAAKQAHKASNNKAVIKSMQQNKLESKQQGIQYFYIQPNGYFSFYSSFQKQSILHSILHF
jgi:hypothetical protein